MVDLYDLKSGRTKIVPTTPTDARHKMLSLCTYRKLRWISFNKALCHHLTFIFPLPCLCVLKVSGLDLHQQIQNCVLYRFFFAVFPSNHSQTPKVFSKKNHLTVFLCHNCSCKLWCGCPLTYSALPFWCPHIPMQTLAFSTASVEFGAIHPWNSASHLILKHYHTTTAKRSKGFEPVFSINLTNGQIVPLAPQDCKGFQ